VAVSFVVFVVLSVMPLDTLPVFHAVPATVLVHPKSQLPEIIDEQLGADALQFGPTAG